MTEYDKGPTQPFTRLFAQAPDYAPYRDHFWFDWGPVYYRGRLNGTARLLCVASDPGPTERIAGRALVGDAGQRVQGFFHRVGLTRSYVCLNAFLYALFPGHYFEGLKILKDPAQIEWRNRLFNKIKTKHLQAVIAFGAQAHVAVDLWDKKDPLPVFKIPHPSSRDQQKLLTTWSETVFELRKIITPDPDGKPFPENYKDKFSEEDYARIPERDLPFGMPRWLGDDAWGRNRKPPHRNCARRPIPDDRHTLIWIAPNTVIKRRRERPKHAVSSD
jgi:uracil-DNA glycosylase